MARQREVCTGIFQREGHSDLNAFLLVLSACDGLFAEYYFQPQEETHLSDMIMVGREGLANLPLPRSPPSLESPLCFFLLQTRDHWLLL